MKMVKTDTINGLKMLNSELEVKFHILKEEKREWRQDEKKYLNMCYTSCFG